MQISNKVKTIIAGLVMVLATSGLALPVAAGGTCPKGSVRTNWVDTVAECNVKPDAAGGDLMTTLNKIINVIIGIVGFIAVIMIIIGGISYSTSAGDPGRVKKAKDTIMYGVIGLVVAILAYAIVNFVLTSLFGKTS